MVPSQAPESPGSQVGPQSTWSPGTVVLKLCGPMPNGPQVPGSKPMVPSRAPEPPGSQVGSYTIQVPVPRVPGPLAPVPQPPGSSSLFSWPEGTQFPGCRNLFPWPPGPLAAVKPILSCFEYRLQPNSLTFCESWSYFKPNYHTLSLPFEVPISFSKALLSLGSVFTFSYFFLFFLFVIKLTTYHATISLTDNLFSSQ